LASVISLPFDLGLRFNLPQPRPLFYKLATFAVHALAVIAEPITAITGAAFVLRDVTAWRTRAVVVVDALCRGLLNFVD